MVREAERQRKAIAAEQKRLIAQQKTQAREQERAQKLREKEDKQRYLEARQEETDQLNQELQTQISALQSILAHTLSVDDTISFDSLRIVEPYQPVPIPQSLTLAPPAPQRDHYIGKVKPPTLMESALRMKGRYQRELQAAESQYEAARRAHEQSEQERRTRLRELQVQDEADQYAYQKRVHQRNQEVDELKQGYAAGDIASVIAYNVLVLERSQYPDGFPQEFRLAYEPDPKELVIEYELPGLDAIPEVAEYKYTRTKDARDSKPRKPA
ncbi:MAG: restriction endonuclease, partial [Chloroflexi bacterium]